MHVLGVQRALLRPEQVGTHLSEVRHPVVARDATCVPRASRRGYLRVPNAAAADDDVEPASTSEDEDEDEDDLHESDDETEADIEIVPDLPKPLTEVP
jgi:hypothetical protein